jgi:hypothetical protein
LTAEGRSLIERRDAYELMRGTASDLFDHHTSLGRHNAARVAPQQSLKVVPTPTSL